MSDDFKIGDFVKLSDYYKSGNLYNQNVINYGFCIGKIIDIRDNTYNDLKSIIVVWFPSLDHHSYFPQFLEKSNLKAFS